jgi:hypothetical protein
LTAVARVPATNSVNRSSQNQRIDNILGELAGGLDPPSKWRNKSTG